jgi:acetyl-CoA acyltransferase
VSSSFWYAAARTPFGRSGGAFADVPGATVTSRAYPATERWGVAAICIGVGQALAVVRENVAPGNMDTAP